MQVNNYATKADYNADNTRSKTASAVSKIVEGSVAVFDGVNVVFDNKNLAGVGDLVCKDVNANKRVFIKAGTVVKSATPANRTRRFTAAMVTRSSLRPSRTSVRIVGDIRSRSSFPESTPQSPEPSQSSSTTTAP